MKKTLSLSLTGVALALSLSAAAQAEESASAALIAKGQYLATAGDCGACHTAPGGKPFAGGLSLQTPLGSIYSTNITPSKTAGIGDYSLTDFEKAVRHGVRKDGANLYPAMPYTSYSKVTDEDMQALYAYFMHGVQPVDDKGPQTDLPFPFNIRLSMAGWNLLFADDKPFTPDNSKSAEWNRGAYLVEGLAHCSTCHTPRNALMAEESGKALAGASLGTWFAPNITSDVHAGIGGWSDQALSAYLTTGNSGEGSQAGGPMLEAINKSFSHLTPTDIKAITAYLRDVPAQQINPTATKTQITPAKQVNELDLLSGNASEGANLYNSHCASCHQLSGEGRNGLPALDGNAALRRPVADNAVMAVLDGLVPDHGQAMPAFSRHMNDQQVATLVNYLFHNFGDARVQTTPERVKELRAGGKPSPLLAVAKGGMLAGGAIVLLILLFFVRRRQRK